MIRYRYTFEPYATFAPENRTVNGERNATNDGESTAVHDANELRSVILNDPGTPGILHRAYDNLRGRIMACRADLQLSGFQPWGPHIKN